NDTDNKREIVVSDERDKRNFSVQMIPTNFLAAVRMRPEYGFCHIHYILPDGFCGTLITPDVAWG
ncbi:MAG: hypothetical protein WCI54_02600, partial [Bacteroidia bacterium]